MKAATELKAGVKLVSIIPKQNSHLKENIKHSIVEVAIHTKILRIKLNTSLHLLNQIVNRVIMIFTTINLMFPERRIAQTAIYLSTGKI